MVCHNLYFLNLFLSCALVSKPDINISEHCKCGRRPSREYVFKVVSNVDIFLRGKIVDYQN